MFCASGEKSLLQLAGTSQMADTNKKMKDTVPNVNQFFIKDYCVDCLANLSFSISEI